MLQFEFILPSQIIFGCGKSLLLPEKVTELGGNKTLVVTSRGMAKREKANDILEALKKKGLVFSIYSEIPPEPHLEDIQLCLDAAKKQGADLVVGIGGGSVLDVAKKVAMDLPAPSIMLPTTSGTGSVVTHESVFKVDGKKQALVTLGLTPDIAIVDPELSMSMPPRLAAATGMDALAHAVECYESRRSNPAVKAFALEAFNLLKANSRKATEGDRQARINMSLGSLLSGVAFGNSGTALAHALSYPLSNRGVPHGEAVAMVLPQALEFNQTDPNLARETTEIARKVELKWNASWDIKEMTKEVMADQRHLANNPRQATYDDVFRMFEKIRVVLGETK